MTLALRAPFPWFGGKSRAASLIWDAFGNVPNYVEPFAGSLAVLLGRPHAAKIETVNDRDCYLSNFWRALKADPGALAAAADWPVNEADLHARHRWLVDQAAFRERMMTEPEYFDVKIAGWWVWGLCQWIGSGWCIGATPRKLPLIGGTKGTGVNRRSLSRKIPDIGGAHGGSGRGIHASGRSRQIPDLSGDSGAAGRGIHRSGLKRQIPSISRAGRGVNTPIMSMLDWFDALASRLRRVRVSCGDWSRILGPSPTIHIGVTGVFLDPPYDEGDVEYSGGGRGIAADVGSWCREHGDDKRLRIALCGYEGDHNLPGWRVTAWKAHGGYGGQNEAGNDNPHRERIGSRPVAFDRR